MGDIETVAGQQAAVSAWDAGKGALYARLADPEIYEACNKEALETVQA